MQGMSDNKPLKSQNMKWLVALVVADLLVVTLFLVPSLSTGASLSELGTGRALITTLVPVFILLIVNVLPHDVKAMVVYWRPRGWLPGCEAFTNYGPRDLRVQMQVLEAKLGVLPTDPKEQNRKWYELYKQVDSEPEVSEAQRHFLMYRDMAVLSLPFIVLAPLILYLAGASPRSQWAAAGLFTVQYIATALSGNWSGIRFVTNVLAVQSVRGHRR
jgi:hypothetical protein